MGKSKYLNMTSLFANANNITTIQKKKGICNNLTILDLFIFINLIKIDERAFEECMNLITVSLPQNIEEISNRAFNDCSISYLNFNNLTNLSIIGNNAFANNKFKRLDLSYCTNLKTIGDRAFSSNYKSYPKKDGIKILKLPQSLCDIGKSAFEDNMIENLDISNCINLKIINDSCFYKNKIKILKLPNTIEIICDNAFEDNQIEELDLSNCTNLKNIKHHAFIFNPLKEIKILDKIEIICGNDQLDYSWNKFVDFYNSNGKKAGDYKLINNQWQMV